MSNIYLTLHLSFTCEILKRKLFDRLICLTLIMSTTIYTRNDIIMNSTCSIVFKKVNESTGVWHRERTVWRNVFSDKTAFASDISNVYNPRARDTFHQQVRKHVCIIAVNKQQSFWMECSTISLKYVIFKWFSFSPGKNISPIIHNSHEMILVLQPPPPKKHTQVWRKTLQFIY